MLRDLCAHVDVRASQLRAAMANARYALRQDCAESSVVFSGSGSEPA